MSVTPAILLDSQTEVHLATNLTEAEVKAIVEGYATKALANLSKPPKYELNIDVNDGEEPRWIGVDIDFTYADRSPQASKDAHRALDAFAKLVDADDRVEIDEEGGGDDSIGLSLSIGRSDDELEEDDEDED